METAREASYRPRWQACGSGLEPSAATEPAREWRDDHEGNDALVRHLRTENGFVVRWAHTSELLSCGVRVLLVMPSCVGAQLCVCLKKLGFRYDAVSWTKYSEAGLS